MKVSKPADMDSNFQLVVRLYPPLFPSVYVRTALLMCSQPLSCVCAKAAP